MMQATTSEGGNYVKGNVEMYRLVLIGTMIIT